MNQPVTWSSVIPAFAGITDISPLKTPSSRRKPGPSAYFPARSAADLFPRPISRISGKQAFPHVRCNRGAFIPFLHETRDEAMTEIIVWNLNRSPTP
jgi:hypothetical protein